MQRVATRIRDEAQNESKMEKQINLEVIDQMFAAQMSMNESEETMKALRPQVDEAVRELIRQQGLPRTFTGTIPYHGFKIVVSRPKSYTWELNTQIKGDELLEYYKKQHASSGARPLQTIVKRFIM